MLNRSQRIYVVRIWRESTPDGTGVWRASATDTLNQEKRFFSSVRSLIDYLGLSEESETGPFEPETL